MQNPILIYVNRDMKVQFVNIKKREYNSPNQHIVDEVKTKRVFWYIIYNIPVNILIYILLYHYIVHFLIFPILNILINLFRPNYLMSFLIESVEFFTRRRLCKSFLYGHLFTTINILLCFS